MAKTGLFGFGYINEAVFYGKLGDLLNRDVTAQDKQSIHTFVQRELDRGCIEYFTCDRQGGLQAQRTEPENPRQIVAKAVRIGMSDAQGQEILAYVCQQPGRKWSTIYVGARPQVLAILESYHIGYLNFRNFRQANEFICGIHDILLPGEQWGFSRAEENPALVRRCTRYQILESYLRHTFSKLMLEYNKPASDNYGKIVFSTDGKYCYFNTGLLTKYAQDLYLTGEVRGMKDSGVFTCDNPRFVDSKIELVKSYGFAQRDIDPGPGVASFYKSVSEIVYDPSITIDFTESKLEHIIDDGIRRGRFPKKYTISQTTGKPVPPWSLAQMLNSSIKIACMMAQRNFKYVIPQYRPAGVEYVGGKKVVYEGQIQFLMPIYLSADYFSPPDFALVLSRRDGFYVPETILLLPWAYNNARILCKPDNSWLSPSAISAEDLLLAEEDDEDDADEREGFEEPAPFIEKKDVTVPVPEKKPAPVPAPEKKPAPVPAPEKKPAPLKEKKTAPTVEKKAEPAKAEPQADALIGQVLVMEFTGTTASKALRAECGKAQGTISTKKLGGHRAVEFHGLSARVKILSRNSNGGSYQCELAEGIDDVLARRASEKPLQAEKPAAKAAKPVVKPEKPAKKAEKAEKKPEPAKKPASGGWAWADPTNLFTQRPTVVDSFRDLAVGQRYNATVRDFVAYGVFVDIGYAEGNVLLHKSQMLEDAQLQAGDVITVWIHALDTQHKKVQVTMHRPE